MVDQNKIGNKGLEMEEALRSYFFEAGYFVVRGIPFRLEDEDVTDIDLWLYERPAAATRRRLIVDVKNKKSPKAAERIIWTKGLQAALGADGAVVATTDRRSSSKRLAKSLGIVLFDGDAVAKVASAKRVAQRDHWTSSEFDSAIKQVDQARRSTVWKSTISEARSSLLSGLGAQSANQSLAAFQFFAQQSILAQPDSNQAELATRLAYSTAALTMISLDYIIADHAFRSLDDRRTAIINSVRFGQSEITPQLSTVNTAVGLARKYAVNGGAVARQIDIGFRADAEAIPAEIIADFTMKVSAGDTMFQIARELESASISRHLPGYDVLSTSAKSTLGAFLDFGEQSREDFAISWQASLEKASSDRRHTAAKPIQQSAPASGDHTSSSSDTVESSGPLFDTKEANDGH